VRQEGVITRWEDERGFGFITPITAGSSVFVHASECPPGPHPVPGQVVTFQADRDDRNRLRASDVHYVGLSHRRTQIARGLPVASVVAVVFFGLLGVLAVLGLLPGVAVALSVLSSVAAFVLYRTDKAAAARGAWRVSESTLHLVSSTARHWPCDRPTHPTLTSERSLRAGTLDRTDRGRSGRFRRSFERRRDRALPPSADRVNRGMTRARRRTGCLVVQPFWHRLGAGRRWRTLDPGAWVTPRRDSRHEHAFELVLYGHHHRLDHRLGLGVCWSWQR